METPFPGVALGTGLVYEELPTELVYEIIFPIAHFPVNHKIYEALVRKWRKQPLYIVVARWGAWRFYGKMKNRRRVLSYPARL